MSKKVRELYSRKREPLLGFIRSRISNVAEAEDILQDVFHQALLNQNIFETLENGAGWLFTVARNRITDWYRRKENSSISLSADQGPDGWEDIVVESGIQVEDEFEKKLVGEAILQAVEELPAEQKEVFIKNTLYGITFREMAEESGVSINTLLARKRYAMEYLRGCLGEIKEIMNGQ